MTERTMKEIRDDIEAYDNDLSNYDGPELVNYWKNRKPLTDELEEWFNQEYGEVPK